MGKKAQHNKTAAHPVFRVGQIRGDESNGYVAEKTGAAVVNLNRIEDGIGKVLDEIRAEHKKVTDSIKVVV